MKPIRSRATNGVQHGTILIACDNSGAKLLKIISFKCSKTTKGRVPSGGIAALANASVIKGTPEMRKKVVPIVVVRVRKSYRRPDGTRIKFEDNAAVVLKDLKGNPAGTLIKGPIAKEACERWGAISKIASIVV